MTALRNNLLSLLSPAACAQAGRRVNSRGVGRSASKRVSFMLFLYSFSLKNVLQPCFRWAKTSASESCGDEEKSERDPLVTRGCSRALAWTASWY